MVDQTYWMTAILILCSTGTLYVSFNRVVALKACKQSSNSGSLKLRALAKSFSAIAFATS